MKQTFLSLLLVILPLAASADKSGTCGKNLTWTYVESIKTLTISGRGAMTDYTDSPWKSLNITTVVIQDGVTSIGNCAFQNCSGLTSVTIPNTITSIGGGSFANCSELASVTIPKSVTSMGRNVFYGTAWYELQSEGVVYAGHIVYTYKGMMPQNTSIIIKEGAVCFAKYAFSGYSDLTSVTIPNSITSIGDYAFAGCGLTSVTIPNSVESIGKYSFWQCGGLSFITIGNSVTSIGAAAFSECSNLASVTIPSSVTYIGSGAFYGCYLLNTIYCLNPTPPTCNGLRTFTCSTNDVRDQYDVYTYATLHVPMGSGNIYSSAYEWRYFNKIKEDMEVDGRVYYANLTIKQGTTGYTRQAVKAAEKYTIYIGSLGENKVNAVTFNGEDVTDMVANGYYTTPEIKGESVLSISYETATEVRPTTLKKVKVTGNDSEISISQIDEPSDVFVYSVDGKLVGDIPSAYGSVSLRVPPEQLYIVKVGHRTYKVAL